jgi:hypothetical protein
MAKKRTKSLPPPGPVLPPAPPTGKARASMLLRIVLSLVLVVGLVVLVAWLGQMASGQLGQRDRYRVPLDRVMFDVPPKLDRASFLAEVRYVSRLPETVDTADRNLLTVLKPAFEKHPWVEQLDAVVVRPDGEVRLSIRFRTPQLAIFWRRVTENETRALDKHGVLLPVDAVTTNLPTLLNERTVDSAEAGKPWPEAEVQRAVQLSCSYPVRTISRTKTGWHIIETTGKTLSINTP